MANQKKYFDLTISEDRRNLSPDSESFSGKNNEEDAVLPDFRQLEDDKDDQIRDVQHNSTPYQIRDIPPR